LQGQGRDLFLFAAIFRLYFIIKIYIYSYFMSFSLKYHLMK